MPMRNDNCFFLYPELDVEREREIEREMEMYWSLFSLVWEKGGYLLYIS
jgi:hypothetical protein